MTAATRNGDDESLDRLVASGTARGLAKLGLDTRGELLRHYPRRYADPGRMTDFTDLPLGDRVTIIARTQYAGIRRTHKGDYLLSATITDGKRQLRLTFFGKSRRILTSREHALRPGRLAMFTGTIKEWKGQRELQHPQYQFLDSHGDNREAIERASWPIPIYPATSSLPSWKIQSAVQTVLRPLREADLPDPLPEELREQHGLPSLLEALHLVHEPRSEVEWRRGQHRLRYEEAFVLQTVLAQRRARVSEQGAVPRPLREGGIRAAFVDELPFTLTPGQREVIELLGAELGGTAPMQRLLQGEVGSGKTVAALLAMLQVIDAGGQAALLAPTEVLAAQHERSITALLGPLAEAGMLGGAEQATRVVLLTGAMPAAQRREALAAVASGEAGIIIGTHALLSEHVRPADLGLVVVDEQHRFGVEQRDALRAKASATPHLLVMTATPIPRTVAMTVFGDLETATLREVPAGRPGVRTYLVPSDRQRWRQRTWQLVAEEVADGGRVYVVAPRITSTDTAGEGMADDTTDAASDEGETSPGGFAAVEDVAECLRDMPELAGITIAELHGRLSSEEKETVMADFMSGAAPVLVSTTVIEVGVDVPAASAMVILDADRFGISQLHQLRGRIGRGTRPGTCLVWSSAPEDSPTAERLAGFAATTDGFELARLDLAQRREGDILGAAQSGRGSSLRLLRVLSDAELIDMARRDARQLIATDPGLQRHEALAHALESQLAEDRTEFLHRA